MNAMIRTEIDEMFKLRRTSSLLRGSRCKWACDRPLHFPERKERLLKKGVRVRGRVVRVGGRERNSIRQ